jgi:hypothetical protein
MRKKGAKTVAQCIINLSDYANLDGSDDEVSLNQVLVSDHKCNEHKHTRYIMCDELALTLISVQRGLRVGV